MDRAILKDATINFLNSLEVKKTRPLVKSAYQKKKKNSYFSTNVVVTQMNLLNETVLLSTQNICSN